LSLYKERDTWYNRRDVQQKKTLRRARKISKNTSKLVEEFEREYGRAEEKEARQQETKEDKKMFNRELPGRYTAKLLYGWGERKYKQKYWKRLEENWRQ